jgi:hypothetical protein
VEEEEEEEQQQQQQEARMAARNESAARRRKTRKADMCIAASRLPLFRIYRCIPTLVGAAT